MNMTLVVMAAGLGSRYGGVKQIERLGPAGEILMEYAIYDALRAGFDHIVIIIKPEMLQDVRELFGDRIEQRTGIRIDYAFQVPERFTEHYEIPPERTKPLGTVHAVLCAEHVIHTPFAVITRSTPRWWPISSGTPLVHSAPSRAASVSRRTAFCRRCRRPIRSSAAPTG